MMNQTIRILGLGALAGMRTMSAQAALVTYLRRKRPESLEGSALQPLTSPAAESLIRLLAAGELAGDKVPGIPPRTEALALFARAFSGGLAGYAVGAAHGTSKGKGAILGAAAAVASALAAFHTRKTLVESLGVPDLAVALAEDALVVAGGRCLIDD